MDMSMILVLIMMLLKYLMKKNKHSVNENI